MCQAWTTYITLPTSLSFTLENLNNIKITASSKRRQPSSHP